jgi:hypothetical protein
MILGWVSIQSGLIFRRTWGIDNVTIPWYSGNVVSVHFSHNPVTHIAASVVHGSACVMPPDRT